MTMTSNGVVLNAFYYWIYYVTTKITVYYFVRYSCCPSSDQYTDRSRSSSFYGQLSPGIDPHAYMGPMNKAPALPVRNTEKKLGFSTLET